MNIKKMYVMILLFAFLLHLYSPFTAYASISVSARNAILIDQESGRIIFEKAAYEKRRIASITKIMTAIIAIESDKLDETVTISERAAGTEGSSLYLKEKERIKLEDLVYGLMLRSGNDAAIAIAEYIGGSVEGFVFLMNQKAQEIGMTNTHFSNPHGLDNSKNHYSTAYDMAILTKYAMESEVYQKITGTKVHRTPNPKEKWDRVWKNKNRLLTGKYEYTTGGKTGYTKLAKRTLVSTASKGEIDLIAVTLNDPDDWNDHINMYETAFKTYDMVEVISEGKIKNIDDKYYRGKIYFEEDFRYPATQKEKDLFHIEYKLSDPEKIAKKKEQHPEIVGTATVYLDNKPIKKVSVYLEQSKVKEPSFLDRFKNLFTAIIGVKTDG